MTSKEGQYVKIQRHESDKHGKELEGFEDSKGYWHQYIDNSLPKSKFNRKRSAPWHL